MATNMSHMVQLVLPLTQFVSTLSRQLSWGHFVNQPPPKTEPARQFYASQAATNTDLSFSH
jgi:hypothetical protein